MLAHADYRIKVYIKKTVFIYQIAIQTAHGSCKLLINIFLEDLKNLLVGVQLFFSSFILHNILRKTPILYVVRVRSFIIT